MRALNIVRCLAPLLLIALHSALPAGAAAPRKPETKTAETANDRLTLAEAVGWQVALEREGFSAGIIDGKVGRKAQLALREYQRAHDLEPTGLCDAATLRALDPFASPALEWYVVGDLDAAQVTGPFKGWLEKSQAKRIGYPSLDQCIAEKFHCTRALLGRLNPKADLSNLKPGDTLLVPAVAEPRAPRLDRLEINLAEKAIRGFDRAGNVLALFHCSIAKDPEKRPEGTARVTNITHNPNYLFDPAMWPEVKGIKGKLLIPPGPRNPVGLCWIQLSLPGYGIHGTPEPENIGKTGSHGCFRLTNWDAVRLSTLIQPGIAVTFVGEETDDE